MDDEPSTLGGRPASPRRGLIDRVKAILLTPKTEWPVIDTEPGTIGDIYRGYVIPLAAIGPVAMLIGQLVFGYSFLGIVYRPAVATAVTGAIVQYAMQLLSVYVLALVIDALAPRFGGVESRVQAFKVAAYSATASWVAGIFAILPALAVLGLLGLYSLYLLYLGLPVLMKVSRDKAAGYVAVVIVAMIVIYLVVGAVTSAITGSAFSERVASAGTASGSLVVPGVGAVDLAKIDAASKQMEATAKQMQATNGAAAAATATALPASTLQGMLPAALPGGFVRTSLESDSVGSGGMNGSTAKGEYGSGATTIRLEITDLGGAAALAALGSAFNVQSSRQDGDGYERTDKVGGRLVTEKWQNESQTGSYSVLVANRFLVAAEGDGAPIDAVKAAVGQIDFAKLEGMAKS